MTPQTVNFYPPHQGDPSVVPADASLEDRVLVALRAIYDPEISVNIHDLGLIYGLSITPQGRVDIRMTLTSPACPVAGSLPCQVEQAVRNVDGVSDAGVELVWDPPWTQERMSESAQLELGIL